MFKKKYIAGISGGPDSIALLYKYRKKIQVVCCVNYHVRFDSYNDVSIVKEMCNQYNIKCFVKDVNQNDFTNSKLSNFENWARQVRYDFFVEISKQFNLKKLLIAHNFNDWLETAYMSYSKKSMALYYGIKQKSYYQNLEILRPLLRFQKDTLKRFNDEKKINYAIDYTNELDDYERNRVRKLIKTWNSNEIYNFKKKIDNYNKSHKKQLKTVEKRFILWTKKNWSISYIKNLDKYKYAYYLVYNFLKIYINQKLNYQKIINILDFILNKNSSTQKYRLGNEFYLKKYKMNNDWYLNIESNNNENKK